MWSCPDNMLKYYLDKTTLLYNYNRLKQVTSKQYISTHIMNPNVCVPGDYIYVPFIEVMIRTVFSRSLLLNGFSHE